MSNNSCECSIHLCDPFPDSGWQQGNGSPSQNNGLLRGWWLTINPLRRPSFLGCMVVLEGMVPFNWYFRQANPPTVPETNIKRPWKSMVGRLAFPFGARPMFRGFCCFRKGIFQTSKKQLPSNRQAFNLRAEVRVVGILVVPGISWIPVF